MTTSDLADLLIAQLLKREGGTKRRWRQVVGAVRWHDPATHPHCNWSLEPGGSARESEAVETLLDELRLRHPIVTQG
ncbi:hypothetical protein SAMN06297144_2838 [Sphingomonas guangdongensis]|uniref:Uncharacterized protein n=1 Tax=Sphingomonas guangdongensis TaxID=1141890 RepID=A0A285R5S3_9SPHN|nr:hypothetical protein [Sphingomonas guangdongensis]SOB87702.1 hypothetical protein SAMN06297144_2838 [Sphingomonas guangdongensis]